MRSCPSPLPGKTVARGAPIDLSASLDRLTDRQKDCLRLVAQGFTSKEIGRRLGISHATVDNHMRAALEVLQVESRAEAARILAAAETGQPLTSQPPRLAEPTELAAIQPSADPPRRLWRMAVPPVGGTRNELSMEAKVFAILRVAALGFSSLAILTIGIATLLWLLR